MSDEPRVVRDEYESVLWEQDPWEQARRATALLEKYRYRARILGQLRAAAVERLYAEGHGATEVAQRLGVSKGRVSQIVRRAHGGT